MEIKVELLGSEHWQRLKILRLAALSESGFAFGAKYEKEAAFTDQEWIAQFARTFNLIATCDGFDAAIMTIDMLVATNGVGDYATSCWVGSCWTNPTYRGQGIFRELFQYIDSRAVELNWHRQGLGVWADNFPAISAYEALGFKIIGEPQPSLKVNGKFFLHMVRDAS